MSPRNQRLITVRVNRKRAYAITHHPLTRVAIFGLVIAGSVVLTERFLHSHYAAIHFGSVAVGSFIARGLEVLTDCLCDRLFPSA